MTTTLPHRDPAIVAEVMAANRDRLMAIVAVVQDAVRKVEK